MKHKFSFITTFWWVLLLGLLGGMLVWLAPKDQRISEAENRNLAGAPELSFENIIDGSFMLGVEDYLSDGFFDRGEIIRLSMQIKNVFNIKTDDETSKVDMEQAVNEFMDDMQIENTEDETPISTPKETPTTIGNGEDTQVIIDDIQSIDTKQEYTFWLDRTDGSQKFIYDYPVENLEASINTLNAYRQVLPEDGELHFFQIPYGYLANMLIFDANDRYAGWGCDAEDYMQEHAVEGVYIHNGAEILEPNIMNKEMMYFRTDYHWSALGAYYAHVGIRKEMGLPYVEYDDYDYTIHDECQVGSGYADTATAQMRRDLDRLEVMHPMYPTKSYAISHLTEKEEGPIMYYNLKSYLAYLCGTQGPWRQIVTGADTGRNCMILTDSFGNAFTPYMFPYYDEVHVLDLRPRNYSKSDAGASVKDYIEYYEIDDIYVMMSTSSSMNSGYMLYHLPLYLDYTYE